MNNIELMPGEEFRPIAGYCGRYSVSNMGRVASAVTFHGVVSTECLRILSGHLNKGYARVTLCSPFGAHRDHFTHRLVCAAFLPLPDKLQTGVNHIDGNKLNNCLWNLEWATPKENIAHAIRSGLRTSMGSSHYIAKLTEPVVVAMRMRRGAGESLTALAKEYGVSKGNASQICNRQRWKHVA